MNQFCINIKQYNQNNANKIKLLNCLDDKVHTGNIYGANYFYWLFEKPVESFDLSEICKSDCAKDRVCRYGMKDFIKGYINSKPTESKGLWDPTIVLSPNTIYLGKLNKDDKSTSNSFISIAFPNIKSISELSKSKTENDEEYKFQMFQVELGNFLDRMYVGFEDDNGELSSENFSSNSYNVNYRDSLEIFNKLNPDSRTMVADEYFGINKEFINLARENEQMKQREILQKSFYEFLYKLLNNKFKKLEEISKDSWVTTEVSLSQIKSDTIMPSIKPLLKR